MKYAYDDSESGNGALKQVYGSDRTHPYWTLTAVDVTGAVSGAQVNGAAIDVTHVTDRATGRVMRLQAAGWGNTIEDEQYGYDVWGNRTSREQTNDDWTESYSYDADNRLVKAVRSEVNGRLVFQVTTLTASYDLAGNFQSRGGSITGLSYTYQSGNADKLASVSGALTGGFSYDGAGRILTGPDGLNVTYNARGLATVLHKSDHSAELIYAPDGHRYESILDGTTTEYYLAGGAFRILQSGGVTTYREAVVVGGVTVAQLTTRSNATNTLHYFFHDALGSIVAITGAAGSEPIQRLAYGPYGRMRSVSDWSSLLGPSAIESLNLPTRRGYTGGEALTALGLVHLGARIYDPALGLWLSPDPAGARTPYVYVHDNPLSDTDPNGQMSLGQIVTIAALVALSVVSMGALSPLLGMYLAAMVVGAGMGFISGMIASNGNLHAGLMGALGGAVAGVTFAYLGGLAYAQGVGGMFEKAAVEGFAGGALSDVEGGSFSDGFLGSFVSSMGGDFIKQRIPGKSQGAIMERTAAAAALGGTAARITGGSFANGAISAAFQHLFNDEHLNWEGMAGMKSKMTPAQMRQQAGMQKKEAFDKQATNCARHTLEKQIEGNTPAWAKPVLEADPARAFMTADLSHVYVEAGLQASEHGSSALLQTGFFKQSGSLAARAGRLLLPKASFLAGALSKGSLLWSGAAFVGDGAIMFYSEYQGISNPSVPSCMPNPY